MTCDVIGRKKRIREMIEIPGAYPAGRRNSITDVDGVTVGSRTVIGGSARTGVTLISPHRRDPYRFPTPCAVAVGNGYGKLTGSAQVNELGVMESVIGLTGTFSVCQVVQGILNDAVPRMEDGDSSMNVLVGETNDGYLSDMRSFPVRPEHVAEAFSSMSEDVEEGSVGAGTGTICFGFKGGIGTASRIVPACGREYAVGVLVQTNFGGHMNLYGIPVESPHRALETKGSCMIVAATDAPMDARQLARLARRGLLGLAMAGSYMGHGSGDFCIAFSNCPDNIFDRHSRDLRHFLTLPDEELSPFFDACSDAARESVYDSLVMSGDTTGRDGHFAPGFDAEAALRRGAGLLKIK